MDIKAIVIEELEKITGMKDLKGDMTIFDDLRLSSLEAFEMLGDLEEKIGKEIDEDRLGEVSTIDELVELLTEIVEG